MSGWAPLEVSGYVLAGGRSSRMGRDKALLELGGRTLLEHGLVKLRRLCAEVAILSQDAGLERWAPVVRDLHPGCGPLGGMEAALAHAGSVWSLVLPVDVPLVPTALLRVWMEATLRHGERLGTRVAMFSVDGRPQPTLVMLHREMAPYLSDALEAGRYKVLPVLEEGARELAMRQGTEARHAVQQRGWSAGTQFEVGQSVPLGPRWSVLTPGQKAGFDCFFWNVNTPEDFALAEQRVGVLDTLGKGVR